MKVASLSLNFEFASLSQNLLKDPYRLKVTHDLVTGLKLSKLSKLSELKERTTFQTFQASGRAPHDNSVAHYGWADSTKRWAGVLIGTVCSFLTTGLLYFAFVYFFKADQPWLLFFLLQLRRQSATRLRSLLCVFEALFPTLASTATSGSALNRLLPLGVAGQMPSTKHQRMTLENGVFATMSL